MRVLVLDTLIDQTIKHKIPNNVLPRLHKEYRELARLEKEGYNAIYTYLTTGNNGKQMHGTTDITIYKFQLTDGDRILYTYGKYLPYLHNERDSLVLLGYSNHDDQGFIAKHKKFKGTSHSYKYLNNIVRELNNICENNESLLEEDLYEIAALIISESFKGYAYTDEELKQFSADEIEKHLLLSEEQKEIITDFQLKNSPTLIMGGAGTGKTLIAVHMLSNLATQENECSIAYFTQSKILLEKVQQQYNQLKNNNADNPNNIIDFWDINKFCLNLIDVKENELVNTKHFIEKFIKGYLQQSITGKKLIEKTHKNNISFDNIWTEIRGTLKGGMQNWTRTNPMSQDNVSFNVSKYEKLGYIERLKDNKKLFVLKDSVAKTIVKKNNDENLEFEDKQVIDSIIKYFSNFNSDLQAIEDSYYLSLSDENSLLTKEQRQLVLDIYREYEIYLKNNNLYDENDLVRLVIKSNYHKNNSYDFIFVDEVQDYTELQIYLIYELAKNKNTLVFAGDIHQIINPTLFSISKLNELFRENKKTESLQAKPLSTNFRCQKGIVDLANKLSDLRRSIIGSQSIEVEQPEKSNVSICLYDPYRLNYSEKNIKDMMLEIIKYPQVVVLVPDTTTKEYLLDFTKDFERPDFIFTVDEIKGMEYDYIICFNLISHYYDVWNRITTQNIKSEKTRYRFYFNLLYVAITRSRKHLCFIDDNIVPTLEKNLNLKPENEFDAEVLHFSELDASIDSWLNQAYEYKQQGRYANALQFYIQIKDYADINDIYDCHIGIADEDYNYELAMNYCMLKYANTNNQTDLEKIEYYLKLLEKSSNLYKLAEFLLGNNSSSKKLAELIDVAFKNFSDEEKDSISNLFLSRVEELMFDKLSNKRIPEIERMG